MLFGRRPGRLRRVLVVEDEPLVAFDNETQLIDAGYEVVATVDNAAEAMTILGRGGIDLVVTDIAISGQGDGLDVARAGHAAGAIVLYAAGQCPKGGEGLAIACLAKPFTARMLRDAIMAIEERLAGQEPRRPPQGMSFYP